MTRRRPSTCPLHHSPTGVCPSCLRHRLSSLLPDPRLSPDPHPRRNSCDRPRVSLSRLLDADSPIPHSRPPNRAESVHPRACHQTINKITIVDEDENRITMKEHIELEFEQRRRSTSSSGSSRLWARGAASVQKWKLKRNFDEDKKKRNVGVGFDLNGKAVEKPTVVMRRRSCDTDTRLLAEDAPRRCSVDEPPRASWDGYMIARTIPRLAPMLSVIENAMMNEQMLATIEDFETNSVSESSSSQRRNSFDCSSSGKSSSKHRAPVEIDHVKSAVPVAKIVVSGSENIGFDLYKESSRNKETGSKSADSSFKRKMLKILGFKNKPGDAPIGGTGYDLHHRSPNVAEMNKSRSVKYPSSTSDFENGLLKFQSTPSPLGNNKKPERRSAFNSHSTAKGVSRFD